jgi:hypothetical protein
MGLLAWFKRGGSSEDPRRRAWREAWTAAATAGDSSTVHVLARELDALGGVEEDLEMEREMLAALQDLSALTIAAAGGLPTIVTGHRVIRDERCHFIAPVSMPDDPSQPGGRLLLTSSRAVFAGGAAARSVPWHAVGTVLQVERDLVLARHDHGTLHRFRCNTFSDALRGAFVARALATRRPPSPPDL